MPDFDFSCDNQLLFKGSPHFWACIVNDEGVRNIYTEPVPQQLWCVYIQLFAWSSPGISNRTGCKEVEHHPDWIFPWDRFYNNTPAVQPDTPEGARQMASYLEDSKQASSNTAAGRPKAEHGIQSPDGRCGSPTGFNCFGKIDGSCCSAHGWCGFSASHCGAGCQGDFGICDEGSSGKASNGTSTSSKVASKASSTGKAPNRTSSKASSKSSSSDKATTSSTGKTPNSTSSKASSKTFSSNKATSSASRTGKASSSSAPAPSNASATSAPKQVMLSPNGQCGGDEGYHCHGFAAGSCCSSAGWCGSSPSHCGTGCQSGFGSCGKTVSTVTKVSEEKMVCVVSRLPMKLMSCGSSLTISSSLLETPLRQRGHPSLYLLNQQNTTEHFLLHWTATIPPMRKSAETVTLLMAVHTTLRAHSSPLDLWLR
ncbi:hypothetical protein PMIN07_004362 [Paraphaeosphaeria minitans]